MTSPQEEMLTSEEVAEMLRVKPRTVQRWARTGRITRRRTPGGHYRFPLSEAQALLAADLAAETPINENGPARCTTTGQALTDPTPA